jgi:hypothetical protein
LHGKHRVARPCPLCLREAFFLQQQSRGIGDGNREPGWFEAAVERIVEGRIYTRRSKIERDITTAFLVDLSGSTTGWVIDTEKKALVVMCEALEAIGDRYAIYGFSGATRDDVAFLIVKDFDEAYGEAIKGRIGNMGSHRISALIQPELAGAS